jgi:hypothetical protein
MDDKQRTSAGDPTEEERRKNLSDKELKELELAGGVEGGLQAGSAGGPSGGQRKKVSKMSGPSTRRDR